MRRYGRRHDLLKWGRQRVRFRSAFSREPFADALLARSICLWTITKKKPISTVQLAHGVNEYASETEGIIPTARWITALACLGYGDTFASGTSFFKLLRRFSTHLFRSQAHGTASSACGRLTSGSAPSPPSRPSPPSATSTLSSSSPLPSGPPNLNPSATTAQKQRPRVWSS